MKKHVEKENTIDRVKRMECCFDALQSTLRKKTYSIGEEEFESMRQNLIRYYESGQWQDDYMCDERGELPKELKRGVLSQDAVYDLLCEIGK